MILPDDMKSVSSPKNGRVFVNGVKSAGFFFGEAHGFNGDNLEACFVYAGQNFALLAGSYSVGLDDCEMCVLEPQKHLL